VAGVAIWCHGEGGSRVVMTAVPCRRRRRDDLNKHFLLFCYANSDFTDIVACFCTERTFCIRQRCHDTALTGSTGHPDPSLIDLLQKRDCQ
jgi:hypothetical protein